MQEKTLVRGETKSSLKNKTEKLKRSLKNNEARKVLKLVSSTFIGFVLSKGSLWGISFPFGIAFCASVKAEYIIPSLLGSVIGYFSLKDEAVKYISALILTGSAKWFLSIGDGNDYYGRLNKIISPILSFCGVFVSSLTISAVFGFNTYDIALGISEGLICASFCFFFLNASVAFENGQGLFSLKTTIKDGAIKGLSNGEMLSIFVSVFALGLSLFKFNFFDVSLGRIVLGVGIILSSRLFFEAGGAIAGVISALCLFLSGSSQDFYLGWSYVLGGLLTGSFSRLSLRAGCLCYFFVGILSKGISSISAAEIFPSFNPLFDMTISALICLFVPNEFLRKLSLSLSTKNEEENSSSVKALMLSKLYDARLALLDISKDAREVSEKLSKINSGSLSDVYSATINKSCVKCKNYRLCFSLSYSEVMDCFNNLSLPLRQKGFVTEEDLSYPLKSRCIKKSELIATVNNEYKELLSAEKKLREVSKIREVVLDQFETLAHMLGGFVKELSEIEDEDKVARGRIEEYFSSLGIPLFQIGVFKKGDGRLTAELYLSDLKLIYLKERPFKKELEEILGVPLEKPEIVCRENTAKITIWEKSDFSCDFAFAQHNAKGEKLCGDSFLVMNEKRSYAYIILSDGMGTGYNAAVDSAMTVSLIKKLILAGVSFDATIRAANGALLCKANEESLSTVDVAKIDLFTGDVSFYKAGSAPSFVKKDDKVSKINSNSLPIGILSKVSFERSFSRIREGDIVLMVSDGVTFLDDEWIKKTLADFKSDNLQELCDDILVTARLKSQKLKEDDITVIAARLKRA